MIENVTDLKNFEVFGIQTAIKNYELYGGVKIRVNSVKDNDVNVIVKKSDSAKNEISEIDLRASAVDAFSRLPGNYNLNITVA